MPSTRLRGHAASVAAARRFVADVLLNRGFTESCIERAVLLTSELVTSAVLDGEPDVSVLILADHPMVRVEIHHNGCKTHEVERAESGYRLQLVDSLSEAWGIGDSSPDGTCNWFEIRA